MSKCNVSLFKFRRDRDAGVGTTVAATRHVTETNLSLGHSTILNLIINH